jgi:hypothetical protein
MMRRDMKPRARLSLRYDRTGWSRTTVWKLRLRLGDFVAKEAVLVALAQGASVEKVGLMRLQLPFLGVAVAMIGRHVRWRRVTPVPRTQTGLLEAAAAWKKALEPSGFRTWLSLPDSRVSKDPRRLETVLVRALVMEVVGRRTG